MKQDLRPQLLTLRRNLSPEMRADHDVRLCEQVLAWYASHPLTSLGVYWPIRGEPDLQAAYAELAERGVQLALPIVTAADAPLQFATWKPGDATITGAMKVPVPAEPHNLIEPQALLIPCVGYNRERARLGYGGGFYDRTLARKPRPLAIGIAYQCTQADFTADEHDILLDAILTETSILA
jgi:5,10-methenyltetrahydrofolate synthetase